MNWKNLLSIIAICTFVGISTNSHAGHATLAEMTYRHVSGDTYEFTVIFYRNCTGPGVPAPPSMSISANSTSLGVSSPAAASLNRLPLTGPGVPASLPPNLLNCTAQPLCYEENVYRGTLDLSSLTSTPQADDWVFSTSTCCYPPLENITGGTIYTECGLNNLDFVSNDAPFWHERRPIRPGFTTDVVINYPVESICAERLDTLEQDVVEYEGHEVKYEFIEPMAGSGVSATYKAGYSLAVPMPFHTPPGFEIDSLDGTIALNADTVPGLIAKQYIVAIKATESAWDTVLISGVLTPVLKEIGYVVRHLFIIVEPSSTCPDNSITFKNPTQKVNCIDTSFNVEMTHHFRCETADEDNSFILLTPTTSTVPVLVDSVKVGNCWNNQISKDFDIFLPGPLTPGSYYLTLKNGTDGNTLMSECGTTIDEFADTVLITVDSVPLASMLGSPDTMGTYLSYLAVECGQTVFDIQLDGSARCSSIDTLGSDFFVVDSNGTPSLLAIKSVEPGPCVNGVTDFVTITLDTPFQSGKSSISLLNGIDGNTLLNECLEPSELATMPIIAPEVSVELGPNIQYLTSGVLLLEAQEGYHYNWSNGDTVRQVVVTEKGQYFVIVSNDFGCTASDTVNVFDTTGTIGINELDAEQIRIFPNPSNGFIYLSNEGLSKTVNIHITDIKGNEVYQSNLILNSKSQETIDLTEQAKGIYFLNIFDKKRLIKSEKISIN